MIWLWYSISSIALYFHHFSINAWRFSRNKKVLKMCLYKYVDEVDERQVKITLHIILSLSTCTHRSTYWGTWDNNVLEKLDLKWNTTFQLSKSTIWVSLTILYQRRFSSYPPKGSSLNAKWTSTECQLLGEITSTVSWMLFLRFSHTQDCIYKSRVDR